MRNKHLKVGFYLPFLMVIIMGNSCSLLLNKKGLQKEKISYKVNSRFDDDSSSYQNNSIFYFYKNLVLAYNITPKYNKEKNKFGDGKTYYIYDIRYKKVLNFDTITDPIFIDTSFKDYQSNLFYTTMSYEKYDTSIKRAHVLDSSLNEMKLKVFDLKYKPSVDILYLSKKAKKIHNSLAPYFDSVYQKRTYKKSMDKEYYDSFNGANNHFIALHILETITKESFSRKERDTIINFLKSIDTTLLKR
jgi:hypothetical protein